MNRFAPNTPGAAARDAALELLELTRREWIERARLFAVRHALATGCVDADDVADATPPPSEVDPRAAGAVFPALCRLGILRRGEYITTSRPEAHCRPLRTWHLADRSAALEFVAENSTGESCDG